MGRKARPLMSAAVTSGTVPSGPSILPYALKTFCFNCLRLSRGIAGGGVCAAVALILTRLFCA